MGLRKKTKLSDLNSDQNEPQKSSLSLGEFFHFYDVTKQDMASALGVTVSRIYQYLSGAEVDTPPFIKREQIEHLTQGLVRADSWGVPHHYHSELTPLPLVPRKDCLSLVVKAGLPHEQVAETKQGTN